MKSPGSSAPATAGRAFFHSDKIGNLALNVTSTSKMPKPISINCPAGRKARAKAKRAADGLQIAKRSWRNMLALRAELGAKRTATAV